MTSRRPAQLPQANLARMRFPLDSESMAEFVAALGRINALADQAAGFIWRLRSDTGEHVSLADTAGDPLLIINLSVWQNYQHLHEFTYRSTHMHYLRRYGPTPRALTVRSRFDPTGRREIRSPHCETTAPCR